MRRIALAAALALALPVAARASSHVAPDPFGERLSAYGDTGVGWTGGDGAYSVPLPDGRTVWMFSDTFLGPVNPDGSRPRSAPLVNNSFVVESADGFETLVGGTQAAPRALVEPSPRAGFYWMGDGTVEGDRLRAFVLQFVSAPLPFAFQQVGVGLATFTLPDLTLESVAPMPRAFGGTISYGAAILERHDATYVYGIEDLHSVKFLHLARAPAGDLLGPWEYWTAAGWSPSPALSARVLSGISNEFSVHAQDGRFLLIAQDRGIGADVIAFSAPAPEGPWGGRTVLFTAPESGGETFTYNAKAHPGRAPDGSLLVSYNVNTTDFNDLYADVRIYRPRFVDVAASVLPG